MSLEAGVVLATLASVMLSHACCQRNNQSMARGLAVTLVLLASLALGCADGEGGRTSDQVAGNVEIFSWWTSGGELEALEELVALHQQKHPNASVTNAAVAYAEGQVAFNRIKGSIPARLDADASAFDEVTRATIRDFAEATKVLALSGLLASDSMPKLALELKASMQHGSIEIIQNYIRANYDSIRQ